MHSISPCGWLLGLNFWSPPNCHDHASSVAKPATDEPQCGSDSPSDVTRCYFQQIGPCGVMALCAVALFYLLFACHFNRAVISGNTCLSDYIYLNMFFVSLFFQICLAWPYSTQVSCPYMFSVVALTWCQMPHQVWCVITEAEGWEDPRAQLSSLGKETFPK